MEFADKTIGPEKALDDLQELNGAVVHDNPEFLKILENPRITYAEKNDFIGRVLGKNISREVVNFIKLLIAKERIARFGDIVDFLIINYIHKEKKALLLKTTSALDLELIKKIEAGLEKNFNRKFKFYIHLDGNLLGGITAQIGNMVIDGSIRGRLRELKNRLEELKV